MAKGSGAVGKKGRIQEGPQIVDSPTRIKIKKRKVGTGGGSVQMVPGLIVGMPKKYHPKPGMEWVEEHTPADKQVAVSTRTIYPKQGERKEMYKTAVENIDKVHTVRSAMNPVQMSTDSGISARGEHTYLSFVEEPSEENDNQVKIRTYSNIDINPGETDPEDRGVTYHEYGHAYDSQALNYRDEVVIPETEKNLQFHRRRFQSENAFRRVQESGDTEYHASDSPFDRWAKAVIKSKAHKRSMKGFGHDNPLTEVDDNADYWNRPREIFARSYAQFVGETADPKALKELKRTHPKNASWSKADFKDIGTALEDVFISRGEYVPKESHYRKKVIATKRIVSNWGLSES